MRLPDAPYGLVIRTNRTDNDAWETVVGLIHAGIAELAELYPGQEPHPLLTFVDDPGFYELSPDQARVLIDEDQDWEQHGTVFLADFETMTAPGRTLLAVTGHSGDDDAGARWYFRLRPAAVGQVHLALSTKMSFAEFVEDVGDDGVYRY
ncbi:hypothetical protein OIA45_45555 (plasmid) [Streptomyces chartreusis]|nr:hypothetical protein OIA45_45555 [Streptomyces chartreusis]